MFIEAVKVRKAGLREYQETCSGIINETYIDLLIYMVVCLVKDLIKGVIFKLITNCTHGLLQVVVFFYAIIICKVGPVIIIVIHMVMQPNCSKTFQNPSVSPSVLLGSFFNLFKLVNWLRDPGHRLSERTRHLTPAVIIECNSYIGLPASVDVDRFWEGRALRIRFTDGLNSDDAITNKSESTFNLG